MKLEELKKLCEEASPPPWHAGTVVLDEDERFIIAARTAMPLLIEIAEIAKENPPFVRVLDIIRKLEGEGSMDEQFMKQAGRESNPRE